MASKQKNELSFHGDLPLEAVVTYLDDLAASVRAGSVPVESGIVRVTLTFGPLIHVKIKAKVKKQDNKLELEFEWEAPRATALKIGNEE